MSWRWIVDARGDKVEVDKPRLAIVIVLALVVSAVAFAVIPSPWDYGILVPLGIAGIALDVRMRRSDDA